MRTIIRASSDPPVRALLAADDDPLLALFTVGDNGLAERAPYETRLAVRRRLSAAVDRRGWVLDFVPTEGAALVFQVRAGTGESGYAPEKPAHSM